MDNKSRHFKTLLEVVRMSNWEVKGNLPDNEALGVAVHKSFESYVAQVAHVRVKGKKVELLKVYCAVDCGQVVNPDTVIAQMESGIVYGLSAALYGQITVKDGNVVEGNFDDYQVLRIDQMPDVVVSIIDSRYAPGGVGEPATPVIGPAFANAIYAATKVRIRKLPFMLERSLEFS